MTERARVILNFHGVGVIPADIPASERPYWISTDVFTRILDLVIAHPKGRDVEMTFDDGNISDLEVCAPLLQERGLTAAFFALSGRIGRPRYLSDEDLRALSGLGMTIGSHGADHTDWRRADQAAFRKETFKARALLEQASGTAIDTVAVPFGAYNRKVLRGLAAAGFRKIYTSDGGISRPSNLLQPRTSIRSDMDLEDVTRLVHRKFPASARLRRAISVFLKRTL